MESKSLEFLDKVALITGASSGIGKATALEFARHGANVVVADVQSSAGLQTTREIEELGRKSIFVQCDVSQDDEVKSMIEKATNAFGRLDYAFNNAGIEGDQAYTADASIENWTRIIDINLRGVWLCMKYEIKQMLKQNEGSIVNCSSIAGLIGFPGIPAYVASKHGVIGLTKTAALEYAKNNIRVNAVCPGVIATPMIDRFVHGEAQALQQLVGGEPIGRLGQPEEIAAGVLWLCSNKSSFVTGHPLVLDGGWVAQ
jgi:NAD(P)-dependent dehydrogenase (short-subunit alcohol dehydrogenase family)